MSSSCNTSCYLSKILLKSNCKHVPADGAVPAQNKREIRKCFTYWGGDRKKCNGHRKSFQKKINKSKKRVVPPTFYVMKWKWQVYSTQD